MDGNHLLNPLKDIDQYIKDNINFDSQSALRSYEILFDSAEFDELNIDEGYREDSTH
jgi:hypothetical protein